MVDYTSQLEDLMRQVYSTIKEAVTLYGKPDLYHDPGELVIQVPEELSFTTDESLGTYLKWVALGEMVYDSEGHSYPIVLALNLREITQVADWLRSYKPKGMTLEQIQRAVEQGKAVSYMRDDYKVMKTGHEPPLWIIADSMNGFVTNLIESDGVTLHGKESDFFIK